MICLTMGNGRKGDAVVGAGVDFVGCSMEVLPHRLFTYSAQFLYGDVSCEHSMLCKAVTFNLICMSLYGNIPYS